MTITELHILLDLGNAKDILEVNASKCYYGYFFVDDEDGHCYLFDDNGNEKDISIIKEIHETMIRKDIKKIVIPNNVTNIKDWAFNGKQRSEHVTIPDSVINIGYWTFYNCSDPMNVIFNGKTLEEVKAMENYPFGINDESIIKCI